MAELPEHPATIEFGRFKVVRHRRELLADGQPVELGGRAFDTLVALLDARGTVLGKDELMSRVWSDRIGREAELGDVANLVTTHRLVTLVGAGGIGKTRLGLEVARHLLARFPDGVFVGELGPLSSPELVPATVATALGLTLVAGTVSR